MQLDISVINKVLQNLDSPHSNLKEVRSEETYTGVPYDGYGRQGEFNETITYYSHSELPENIFVKIVTRTDSYGSGAAIVSVQFVQEVEKLVKLFESI